MLLPPSEPHDGHRRSSEDPNVLADPGYPGPAKRVEVELLTARIGPGME